MQQRKDPKLARAGVSGFNKPKKTPNHPTKSFVVVAKQGDKIKTIRFGHRALKVQARILRKQKIKREKIYYARHNAQDANPSKLSARYWSHKNGDTMKVNAPKGYHWMKIPLAVKVTN